MYIVEFIGNGKSSRAVIQKGQLRPLVRTSVAGQVFTILDEAGKRVTDATLWLAGHEYTPDKDGLITVPFTHSAGPQPIILCQGDFATLSSFPHEQEQYRLEAGVFVDRESLLKRQKATVVLRPMLRVDGRPAPLSLLENVVLQITAVDRENTRTTKEVRDLKLFEDRETTYLFQVPDNLKSIQFTLRAEVQNLSLSKKDELADTAAFDLNGIDETDRVEDMHLLHAGGRYVLEVLGKTGEARADRAVNLELKHQDFTETVKVSLRTDAAGRIALGDLAGIDWVRVASAQAPGRTWSLSRDRCAYPAAIHGKAGEAIYVPYMGKAAKVGPESFSLLEWRGNTFLADRLAAMKLEGGFLVIQDLPRGDYSLLIKESQTTIPISLGEGERREGYVLSSYRQLQVKNPEPLQIVSVEAGADAVRIQLAHIGPDARVHLAATRYLPPTAEYSIYDRLGLTDAITPPAAFTIQPPQSHYEVGRTIGDEYRYILERKYAKKYPGNMLTRPSLLLNPWSPSKTLSALNVLGVGAGGQAFGGVSGYGGMAAPASPAAGLGQSTGSPNLDFLGEPAVVMVNLKPDEKGVITIPRKDLGAHHLLRILAVDAENAVYRQVTLEEAKMAFLDLRLDQAALDPTKHLTEQKQIVTLGKGAPFVVRDVGSSTVEPYDNLGQVYRFYAALHGSPQLQAFSFILNWPKLKAEEKRAQYTKYACHELNFFLYKKDPEFFKDVVKPYLANKKDKTFMDHFLLGDDLSGYLKPWAYEQLNVAERILLAQRVEGEAARTARHVGDLYDLIPPDVNEFNMLFHTALVGSSLETAGGYYMRGGLLNVRTMAEAKAALPADMGAATEDKIEALASAETPPMVPAGGEAVAAMPAEPAAPAATPPPMPADRPAAAGKAKMPVRVMREGNGQLQTDQAAKDLDRRRNVRQLYRPVGQTEEWAENNYYDLPIAAQNAGLVTVNAFWRDYARHDPKEPFLSGNFIYANHNLTEMMLAMALLDLPFEAAKSESSTKDTTLTIMAGGPMIVFDREIRPAQPAAQKTPILVSQNFFRADDRYRHEGNERFDKFVTDEFLISVVYGAQIVVTNPTSSPQKLEVLLQVPRGSMPVSNGLYTRTVSADLGAFSTRTFEYYFYFPLPDTFPQYPVQVARSGELLGFADPVTMKAVAKLSKIDTTSWDYVAQNGTPGRGRPVPEGQQRQPPGPGPHRVADARQGILPAGHGPIGGAARLSEHAVVVRPEARRPGGRARVPPAPGRFRAADGPVHRLAAPGGRPGHPQSVSAPGVQPARQCPGAQGG